MRISQITRRDIADAIMAEGVIWNGRPEESEFLARIFDLNSLPSTDGRFKNAAGDICQHRVNNPEDWSDDWIEQPRYHHTRYSRAEKSVWYRSR